MTLANQQVPPGWYPDAAGVVRFWDGRAWTQQTAPPQHFAPQQYAPQYVHQAPYTVITKSPKRTSHGLHLFLTIITFGMWGLVVWLPITIIHKMSSEKAVTRVGY